MDLSVIIISWNVKEFLINCIRSVKIACEGITSEIIVVDNASTDNTAEEISRLYDNLVVIENIVNIGFPAANNQALLKCKGRYIFLLNPDTIVEKDAIQKLLRFAMAHPDVGLIGPMLQSPNGEIQLVCARSFPTALNWFWYYSFFGQVFTHNRTFGQYLLSYWNHMSSRPIEAICGAAMFMPRSTLEDVGLLDETHPMYLEDIDYCKRVTLTGKEIYYLSDSVIVHYGGQSSTQVAVKAKLLSLEAYQLFFQRYGSLKDRALFRLAIIGASLIRLPILGFFELIYKIGWYHSPKLKQLNLETEFATLFWGLGLMKTPMIKDVQA